MGQELYDDFWGFIAKYKCHVEPPSRSDSLALLEKIYRRLLEQEEIINKLEEEKSQLKNNLSEYQKRDKARAANYADLMEDLKEDINELVEYTCNAINPRKHHHVDEILCKTYEVIHNLDKIPEAVR